MTAMMGLRPSPLLVFTAVLLFGSVAAFVGGYTLCDTNWSEVVKLSHTSKLFFIRSPLNGIGGDQKDKMCSLVLESGHTPLVLTYYFRTIQLGNPDSCSNNSLCIHGVPFCNNVMNGREISYILPENRNSTVYFQTDGGLRSHFDIYVRVQEAAFTQQVSEPRALGKSDGDFFLRRVTYLPGFPYVDFCEINNGALVEHYLNSHSELMKVSPQTPPFYIYSQNDSSGYYTSGAYRSLILQAGPQPLVVTVYFREFNVEYDDNCSYDSLCVHGVKHCGEMGLFNGQLISHILPEYKTSTILFTSDFSVVKRGFVIQVYVERADKKTWIREGKGIWNDKWGTDSVFVTYYQNMRYRDTCKDIPPVYELCYLKSDTNSMTIYANTKPFIIRSPDWNKQKYGNGRDCSLHLKSDKEPLVLTLNYRKFSVERSDACTNDFLCANRVRLCGNWTTPEVLRHILPKNKTFTVRFISNNQLSFSGFEILVTPRLAVNNEEVLEVTKYDPLIHDFKSQNVTYQSGMYYQNKCPTFKK